jgi:ubiquinone/menaquinone biosynthesis C-methylase UbiE
MNRTHLEYLASPAWADRLTADLIPWIERVATLGDDVLEIGPGPGLTTDILRSRADRVTAVEIDDALAESLTARLAGTNVEVLRGDAAALPFEDDRFSAVTCFSVLHHVPSADDQDRILAEVLRVLKPGAGLFATDARDLPMIRDAHDDDVFVPMPPETLVERLERIGFGDVTLEVADYEIRLSAAKVA